MCTFLTEAENVPHVVLFEDFGDLDTVGQTDSNHVYEEAIRAVCLEALVEGRSWKLVAYAVASFDAEFV